MSTFYLTFDFGTDEEKAQQARHKLDTWKQAFRAEKKLLYKFDRGETAPDSAENSEKPEKDPKAAKGKSKVAAKGSTESSAPVKLLVRVAFPAHEKITQDGWVKRFAGDALFSSSKPQTIAQKDSAFSETDAKFEELA